MYRRRIFYEKNTKKILSLLLSLVMIFSLLPVNSLAAEADTVIQEETEYTASIEEETEEEAALPGEPAEEEVTASPEPAEENRPVLPEEPAEEETLPPEEPAEEELLPEEPEEEELLLPEEPDEPVIELSPEPVQELLLPEEEKAAEPADMKDAGEVASGTCGDSANWVLTDDGLLTITGSGKIANYDASNNRTPWYDYKAQIMRVDMADTITRVGNYAFWTCSSIQEIHLSSGLESIGMHAFRNCSSLTSIVIPGGCSTTGGYAFTQCFNLSRVTIREGVESISFGCFQDCSSLTKITVPASVTEVGSEVFIRSGLTEITFLGNAPAFDDLAFNGATAAAYYPADDATWTADVRQNYGGTITWVPSVDCDLYILGTGITDSNLSGVMGDSLFYTYEPITKVLHLRGAYTMTADDTPYFILNKGVEGLTIQMDGTVVINGPNDVMEDDEITHLILNKDTTIRSKEVNNQLLLSGGGVGFTTGIAVNDGAELTLDQADLYIASVTYGLIGGGGETGTSELFVRDGTKAMIEGYWGAVVNFRGGLSWTQNMKITEPEGYTYSNGSICKSNGTTVASFVMIMPYYYLVVEGVIVNDANRDDILGNGVFSFDGKYTLTVNGNYTGGQDVLIDSERLTLIIAGSGTLSNISSSDYTALIRSTGDVFITGRINLKHENNASDNSYGIHISNTSRLVVSNFLSVRNVAYGLAGADDRWEQTLEMYGANVNIESFNTAVSGFDGGIIKEDCEYVWPAYTTVQDGTMGLDSIIGFEPLKNVQITNFDAYDLIIDGSRVYAGNMDDIRSAGVFSFDPETNTLSVSGTYAPDAVWALNSYNRFQPIIDNSIDGLTIILNGDTTLTSHLENYSSFTPVINSTGALTIKGASSLEKPKLKLTALSASFTFDGIHISGGKLTLKNIDLEIGESGNLPRNALLGDGTSKCSLYCDDICARLITGHSGAAVSGFNGGISLQNCWNVSPGGLPYSGAFMSDGSPAAGVIIVDKAYELYIWGHQLYDDNLETSFYRYDPAANVLRIRYPEDWSGAYSGSTLPIIRNYIDGLTIIVENNLPLKTTSTETGSAMIESHADLTIRSATLENNEPARLTLYGNNVADGIYMFGNSTLTLDHVKLYIYDTPCCLVGNSYGGTPALEIQSSKVSLNATDRVVSNFCDITLTGCEIATPGVTIVGTYFESGGLPAKYAYITNEFYDLYINGQRLNDGNRSLFGGAMVYDPETETLTLDGSGGDIECAMLPFIENHIDGLTINVTGDTRILCECEGDHAIIESDKDITINSAVKEGGTRYRLFLRGRCVVGDYSIPHYATGGIWMTDGSVLKLSNTNLCIYGTYSLRGIRGAELRVLSSTVDISGYDGTAVFGFTKGITCTDCRIVKPEEYQIDNGQIKQKYYANYNGAGTVVIYPNGTSYEGYYLTLGDTRVTSENKDDILGDGSASYDPLTRTLTIKNLDLEGTLYADTLDLNLVVNGNVRFYDMLGRSRGYGIYIEDGSLNYSGYGTLTAVGISGGIRADNGITITTTETTSGGGTVTAQEYANTSASLSKEGMYSPNGDITINGGKINVSGAFGIRVGSGKSLNITDGKVIAHGETSAIRFTDGSFNLDRTLWINEPQGARTGNGDIYLGSDIVKDLVIGKAVTYTVKFDGNGQVVVIPYQYLHYGEKIEQPENPTYQGWAFGGWYTEAACINEYDFDTPVTADITLYAKWTRITWTVTFDANGHGTAPAAQTVEYGGTATRPTDPTETGWIFGGWYKEAECRNKFDFSAIVWGNITLYAKWTQIPYTVTFNVNGHGTAPDPQTVGYGGKATRPEDPVAEGWEFGGWYKEPACTTLFSFDTIVTEDITVYAKWIRITFVVGFNANGHGTAPDTQTVEYGGKAVKPQDPVAEGWTFGGWYTEAACTTPYDFNASVMSDLILYAKWTEDVTLTLTFKHNCEFSSNIALHYIVPQSELQGYSNIKLYIQMEKYAESASTPTLQEYTITKWTEYKSGSTLYHEFVFPGIFAAEMGNQIYATIVAEKDGVEYRSQADVYSIKAYAYNRLAKTDSATFRTLLVDMLNYGAAAQIHFKKNAANPVNADLTAEQKAYGTQTDPELFDSESTVTLPGATAQINGKNLVFDSSVFLRYRMAFAEGQDMSKVKIKFTYVNRKNETKTQTVKASKFGTSGSYYTADCTIIIPSDMRCVVSATIYDGSTPISDTLNYSIETYVYNRLQSSTSATFKTLIMQLMKYGISTERHFQ
ncbi:MAG: InlB B-repeat-containing protein [Lachnospiraceae bacterium]|nr:InlB B-repeat-containing protein [Lachnospiraceae bacterium]